MKKNAVAFTISSDLVFAVATLMMDLKEKAPKIADEVVIFHDGVFEKDLNLLNSILPVVAVRYEIPVKDLSIFDPMTLDYFTVMVHAKYECLKLLSKYKNVVYLDPDMVILEDFSDLLERCDSGIKMMPSGHPVRAQLHSEVLDYDMNQEGICACIFVFQDHVDYKKLYEFCVSAVNKYASKLKLPDQAIFDFMIQEHRINVFPIDRDAFSPHPNDPNKIDHVKILHAYGQPKFWNGIASEQWQKNYSKWLLMGGSPYVHAPYIKRLTSKICLHSKRLAKNISEFFSRPLNIRG